MALFSEDCDLQHNRFVLETKKGMCRVFQLVEMTHIAEFLRKEYWGNQRHEREIGKARVKGSLAG